MFPEGRSVVGDWQLLAGKLRSPGFSLTQRGESPQRLLRGEGVSRGSMSGRRTQQ